jgi:hypothetical protein
VHELVVVDNGSTDGTPRFVRNEFPEAQVVALESNVGFGRAVNRGAAETDATTLVFLNNDVVCEDTFLERLVAVLDVSQGVVMAAAALVRAQAPSEIDTAGIELDRTLLAFDYLHGAPVAVLGGFVPDPLGPCAAAAAFDRAAFDAVGGFDERFFAYLEDVDLVVRLIERGGSCRLAAGARAVHRHSTTLGARSASKAELVAWGRGYLLGKYRVHRRPAVFARALVGEMLDTAGRLVFDRNAVGLGPRLAGFRAGLRAPEGRLPNEQLINRLSFVESQRRRLRRRTAPLVGTR